MPVDPTVDVATLMDFTEDDLSQNRIGQLSTTQIAAVKQTYLRQTLGGVFVAVCCAGVGILAILGNEAYFLGGLLVVLGIVFAFIAVSLNNVSVDDLHVQKVTGYLQKTMTRSAESSSYLFTVNDVQMRVGETVYNAFPDNEPFTFYFVQRNANKIEGAQTPISFEPATDVPPLTEKKKAE